MIERPAQIEVFLGRPGIVTLVAQQLVRPDNIVRVDTKSVALHAVETCACFKGKTATVGGRERRGSE